MLLTGSFCDPSVTIIQFLVGKIMIFYSYQNLKYDKVSNPIKKRCVSSYQNRETSRTYNYTLYSHCKLLLMLRKLTSKHLVAEHLETVLLPFLFLSCLFCVLCIKGEFSSLMELVIKLAVCSSCRVTTSIYCHCI